MEFDEAFMQMYLERPSSTTLLVVKRFFLEPEYHSIN